MAWQMWKEGFARFIENAIRRKNDLPENFNGESVVKPGRHSHYYIGDFVWRRLHSIDGAFIVHLADAFKVISAGMELP
jgi:hypothetical protein